MFKSILLFVVLAIAPIKALAEPIVLPNLNKNATGSSLGGGKYALDVSLPPGAVTVSGGANTGSAFGATDPGLVVLGVRHDATGPLTGVADGDVTPFQTDSNGAVKVSLTQLGKSVLHSVRNDYSGTPVTTGAWVQLIASTSATSTEMEIFDSSGQTLELGLGAAASEVHLIYLTPGGNGHVPVAIPSGSRVSVRAVSANATVGELDFQLYQ